MDHTSTILIVDDEPSARDILRGLLDGQGYNLAFAGSGPEALAKAAALNPDLILLDVIMPTMDGFEVCRRLRANPDLAEVPIIMITGLDDQASRLQGLEAGVDDFISKPYNLAELEARVRTVTRLNYQRRLRTVELQEQRDRMQAILQALGEAVVVTDATGLIEYLNPAAANLTGFSPNEALGQNWCLGQNQEGGDALYEAIFTTARAGQTWQGEVLNRRRDGTSYEAALTVAPLYMSGSSDRPAGFVSVQRDVTPLKKAERAKDDFVSNVSHELRTPLSILTLVSENLETFYEQLSEAQRRTLIRDFYKHTQVLNDLIGDLLEISRIDSQRISLEQESVDLCQLAHDEVDQISPLAQQQAHTLTVSGDQPLKVLGNKAQLRQVIRNLLENAVKYTATGGNIHCDCSKLTIPSPDPEQALPWPEYQQLPAGRWAALRVTDNGIGIGDEHLPHLCERFYRVNNQHTIRGTGLGLAIVRELLAVHHGYLGVASTLDKGSTFAIYLPLGED